MVEISIRYNNKADSEKKVSCLLSYPDGIKRILTMKQYQWEWVEKADKNGYPFNDILREAMGLAANHPSGNGYQYDVLDSTKFMLWIIIGMIHAKKHPVANQ